MPSGRGLAVQTLTEAQRTQWDTDGYLVVEGALSDDEVALFNNELDRIRTVPGYEPSPEALGHYAWVEHTANTRPDGFMDRRDLLDYGQHFIDLMDHPGVFDLIVDLMGPHLMLSMTQAIVRPSTDKFAGYTHTDGGEGLREVRVTGDSRPIAMKVLYLLTDVTEDDAGAFTVFPGTHQRALPWQSETPLTPHSPGAVQLHGRAGDAILFPHALWHGPAPNYSGRARKTLLYNYCQMFVRSYDHELTPEVTGALSPRQRRLLGDLGHPFRPGSYFYVPPDQEAVIHDDPDLGATAWTGPQLGPTRPS
jgi:ectoine hydroxylase-related dioxygenase (phytanoyl-CoA dioxygenase family)